MASPSYNSSFLEAQWKFMLELTNENEIAIYVGVPIFLAVVPFWTYSLLLLAVDITQKPEFLHQYKIQTEKNKKLSVDQAKRLTYVVFRNQLFNIPVTFISYFLFKQRGLMKHGLDLPSTTRVLYELTMYVILEEIFFYYSHRILHIPCLFKRFHKVHHEWTAPVGFTALYCHPLEYCLNDLFPILTGPLLCGTHVSVMYLWIFIATMNGVNSHCGYHFPGFPSNEAHDYHHLKRNEVYGILGILDYLHGTNATFKASKNSHRDRPYFSLTPIRKLIPDR